MQGYYSWAIADYTKAIKLSPRYASAFNRRGGAYFEDGEEVKALIDFTEAVTLNPRFALPTIIGEMCILSSPIIRGPKKISPG